MVDPTSDSTGLWAFTQLRRSVNRFIVGGVVLGALTSVASTLVTTVDPSLTSRLITGLVGFGCGLAATLVVGFLWFLIIAPYKQRNELRELTKTCGTLVPTGWKANLDGEQFGEGTWFPPGYKVTMGPGIVTDDRGNTLSGGRIVGPGARGNTLIG